jgi:penicillin-binding protein 1B
VPSLVLGSIEVTPLEVARAFAAIANLGFRTDPVSIRAVIDVEGEALTRSTMRAEQAVSPRVAYLVTHLMQGVIDRGTGHAARVAGFAAPAAGKTGTTNEGRDAWFVGFTPDLLTVVWVGFDRRSTLGLSGGQAALPIWTDFMKATTTEDTPTPFLVPPGIQTTIIDPETGQLATPLCPERIEESFLDGEAPVETCTLHPDKVRGAQVVPAPTESAPPILVPEAVVPTPVRRSWW